MNVEKDVPELNDEMDGSNDERGSDSIHEDTVEDVDDNETRSQQYPTDSIERDILTLFATKSPPSWSYTFSGIRRLLGAHQQTLTNALDRMIEDSILVKDKSGYQLNNKVEQSHEIVREPLKWLLINDSGDNGREKIWIGTTPAFIPVTSVARKLTGRWFDSFRFTGSSINSRKNQATLEWVNVLDVTMQLTVEITHDQLVARLRNMYTVHTNNCLDFLQNLLSKQGILIYFEMDKSNDYKRARNYNN